MRLAFWLLMAVAAFPLVIRAQDLTSVPDCGSIREPITSHSSGQTLESLGGFAGSWEGNLRGVPQPYPALECTWSPRIRVEFGHHTARILHWEKGDWKVFDDRAAVQVTATNAVVSATHVSSEKKWVETWALILTKRDGASILATWVRTVNNPEVPLADPQSRYTFVANGTLQSASQ